MAKAHDKAAFRTPCLDSLRKALYREFAPAKTLPKNSKQSSSVYAFRVTRLYVNMLFPAPNTPDSIELKTRPLSQLYSLEPDACSTLSTDRFFSITVSHPRHTVKVDLVVHPILVHPFIVILCRQEGHTQSVRIFSPGIEIQTPIEQGQVEAGQDYLNSLVGRVWCDKCSSYSYHRGGEVEAGFDESAAEANPGTKR